MNTRLLFHIDRFWQWLANNVLPTRLIYFAFVKGAAIASQKHPNRTPDKIDLFTAMEALETK